MLDRFISVYVTPPTVFVAVLIGGGYGTGREIVEFFSRHGLLGGLAGLAVSFALFGLILGLTFDAARQWRSYDYVSFFKHLIGPAWWLFEILYLLLTLLVLGVLSAAAGEILLTEYGVNTGLGLPAIMLIIALMVFWGRRFVERALSGWTLFMYALFIGYFIFTFSSIAGLSSELATSLSEITEFASLGVGSVSGALYVMYNVSVAPVLLFATRQIQSRNEAYLSAAVTAFALILPALLFHLSFSSADPAIIAQPLPVYWMIDEYAPAVFRILFVLALLGTLLQTGAGLIHGFIERVDQAWSTREASGLSGAMRAGIALTGLVISWALAKLGIVALIARGYSALGIGFALVYVLPLILLFISTRARAARIKRSCSTSESA